MLKAGGNHKQSRLLQMREEYQQRVLKEKEEKLINMYEESQRRAQDRVQRVTKGPSGNAYPNSRLQPPGAMQQQYQLQAEASSSVRDFFRERRELEAKGNYVPPIDQHYRRARNDLQDNSGSGKMRKSSAGVDRAQPLAPIQQRHSAPADSPFGGNRPRLVKPRGTHSQRDVNNNEADKTADMLGTPQSIAPSSGLGPDSRSALKKPPHTSVGKRPSGEKEEKLSDFQKWQLQQAKAREERLKKLNTRVPQTGRELRGFDTSAKEEEDEEEERGYEDEEFGRKQRDLEEKIARQQAELDQIKKQREKEEEQERQEAEWQRKQEAADRERLRRRQQQEESRRKREEAQQRHPAPAGSDDDDENDGSRDDVSNPPAASKTARRAPVLPHKPPPKPRNGGRPSRREPSPEQEPTPAPAPDVDFYAQRALEDDATGGRVKLVACRVCGRKFAEDRVRKHQEACKISQKKRKVFDPVIMRTDGTEMAKYISKGAHRKEHPNKKKDWRAEHESFMESVRYAKKVTKMEQQGVAPKDMPPPPPSLNSGLVPCPHCGRSFNEAPAARHIPRCKELKTKPAPTRR